MFSYACYQRFVQMFNVFLSEQRKLSAPCTLFQGEIRINSSRVIKNVRKETVSVFMPGKVVGVFWTV